MPVARAAAFRSWSHRGDRARPASTVRASTTSARARILRASVRQCRQRSSVRRRLPPARREFGRWTSDLVVADGLDVVPASVAPPAGRPAGPSAPVPVLPYTAASVADSPPTLGDKETRRLRRVFPSGRRDSNSGPPVPQTGALTRLRHAPSCRRLANRRSRDTRGRGPARHHTNGTSRCRTCRRYSP